MLKAEMFNNLLNELHKKEEEKRRLEQQKQQEIQLQMKLVEDSLNDMENKFKHALEKGAEYPKFALIKNILCDEVKKELIMNQGYFLDESFGQTKVFYNKKLFNEYRNNTKQESFKESKLKNKAYEELTKSCLNNKEDKIKTKEYKDINEVYSDIIKELKIQGWCEM